MVATPGRSRKKARHGPLFKEGDEVALTKIAPQVYLNGEKKKGTLIKLCRPEKGLKRYRWRVHLSAGRRSFEEQIVHENDLESVLSDDQQSTKSDESTTVSVTPRKTKVLSVEPRRHTRRSVSPLLLHGIDYERRYKNSMVKVDKRHVTPEPTKKTRVVKIVMHTGTLYLFKGTTPRRAEFVWNK